MHRRVEVSKYEWSPERNRNVLVPDGDGIFHGFGINYEEFESGPGMFTAAIIERPDGTVSLLNVEQIRFPR